MAENTGIEWTEHTFNGWWGCVKVDSDCKNCYADSEAKRRGKSAWGPKAPRFRTGAKYWAQPLKWNEEGRARGRRVSAFAMSMADVFEPDTGQAVLTWRGEDAGVTLTALRSTFFQLVEQTPWVLWLVLTKRPDAVPDLVPEHWMNGWPSNVALGTSVGHQAALSRLDDLYHVKHLAMGWMNTFCSFEPLTERVDASLALVQEYCADPCDGKGALFQMWNEDRTKIIGDKCQNCGRFIPHKEPLGPDSFLESWLDWAIIGGESGPKARACDVDWIRLLLEQCRAMGVAPFVKQLGATSYSTDFHIARGSASMRLRDRKGGDTEEWPKDLRVREFPAWFEEVPRPSAERVEG